MATAAAALLPALSSWYLAVNNTVTQPYLDEVFHVVQAQQYCAGRFHVWDPKITTPPGLYILSIIPAFRVEWVQGRAGRWSLALLGCNLSGLRLVNAAGLLVILFLVWRIYRQRSSTLHDAVFQHSALNVALFPPLFFFSALYYTDIWSTAFVLLFYSCLLNAYREGANSFLRYITLVTVGSASLLFRQTNIFWVSILPAAVVFVHQLDRGHQAVRWSTNRQVEGFGGSFYSVAKTSWRFGVVFNLPIRSAKLKGKPYHTLAHDPSFSHRGADYFKTILSIGVCLARVLTEPKALVNLVMALSPFIALLSLFTAFVLSNGGVVLGDKSNHVATLHVPQMLYIWPFLAFFSWPIIYQYLALLPFSVLARLGTYGSLETMQIFRRRALLPKLSVIIVAVGLACAVVYANTIVHPFTLADNRHYVFYVFRYLLKPWWVRYAVAPVYFGTAWAAIQNLGGGAPAPSAQRPRADGLADRLPVPDGQHSATTAFAIIWLATSALSLITAPLVEPRYFILPWIFWRLHVPILSPSGAMWQGPSQTSAGSAKTRGASSWLQHDHRLWIETAWLLVVNVTTAYMFLHCGFEWKQEPGKVQRFMW
ncbi:glycosyltransferase family 59 protein [Teratosphaeria destructans]|uniref:Dol-P-Glc:Glc(2)Man(9)GlcNAc(2)-PP-Dol alpha-1,2-glucosyltransferase n=1 Tax=Teratosphaeria destructans TaxID=418781 RepID=A0A9W7SU32_9PEZI|nr:glycosyltransferase family 59 protein [Teratosphaeria destructans]